MRRIMTLLVLLATLSWTSPTDADEFEIRNDTPASGVNWPAILIRERRIHDERERIVIETLLRSQRPTEQTITALVREGRLEQALDTLEQLATQQPPREAALTWRRLAILGRDDFPLRAAQANRRALQLAPDEFDYAAAVTEDHLALHEIELAAAQTRRLFVLAQGVPSKEARALLLTGQVEERQSNFAAAIAQFDRAATAADQALAAPHTLEIWQLRCDAVSARARVLGSIADMDGAEVAALRSVDCVDSAAHALASDEARLYQLRMLTALAEQTAHWPTLRQGLIARLSAVRERITGARYALTLRANEVTELVLQGQIAAEQGRASLARQRYAQAINNARAMQQEPALQQLNTTAIDAPLSELDAFSDRALAQVTLASILTSAGEFHLRQGDTHQAAQLLDEAIVATRALPGVADAGDGLGWLAYVTALHAAALATIGEHDRAMEETRRSADYAHAYLERSTDDNSDFIPVLALIAQTLDFVGEPQAARAQINYGLRLVSELRDSRALRAREASLWLRWTDQLNRIRTNATYEAPLSDYFAEWRALSELKGPTYEVEYDVFTAPIAIYRQRGDTDRVEATCQQMARNVNAEHARRPTSASGRAAAWAQECLSGIALERGDFARARDAITAQIALYDELEPLVGSLENRRALSLRDRAAAHAQLLDIEAALQDMGTSVNIAHRSYERDPGAHTLTVLVRSLGAAADLQQAVDLSRAQALLSAPEEAHAIQTALADVPDEIPGAPASSSVLESARARFPSAPVNERPIVTQAFQLAQYCMAEFNTPGCALELGRLHAQAFFKASSGASMRSIEPTLVALQNLERTPASTEATLLIRQLRTNAGFYFARAGDLSSAHAQAEALLTLAHAQNRDRAEALLTAARLFGYGGAQTSDTAQVSIWMRPMRSRNRLSSFVVLSPGEGFAARQDVVRAAQLTVEAATLAQSEIAQPSPQDVAFLLDCAWYQGVFAAALGETQRSRTSFRQVLTYASTQRRNLPHAHPLLIAANNAEENARQWLQAL